MLLVHLGTIRHSTMTTLMTTDHREESATLLLLAVYYDGFEAGMALILWTHLQTVFFPCVPDTFLTKRHGMHCRH
jgi:hypothetical protein